jgi:hypothetical protein
MDRKLHELILEAAAVVENTDHTHTEVAGNMGMARNAHRRWRNRDLREGEGYQAHEKDDERTRSLTEWLQSAPDADIPEQAYGGPADADRNPQSVAAEELGGYGTGDYGRPEPPSQPAISGATAESDIDIERAIEEQHRRWKEKHHRAQKKQRQTIRFDTGPICLVFLGDQHIGNAGTDIKRVKREQDLILQMPGTWCLQMGDLVDNMIIGRLKRQNAKPSSDVWSQWQVAKWYLERFSEHESIVGYVGGNHGAFTLKLTGGIDYRRDICPDGVLFDGDDIKVTVSVGAADYTIWARHKWRGNSIYNPTHGQERAMRFQDPDPDIYVGAHTHEGSMYREVVHEGRRKAAIQLGTYKIHDDYAREQGYPGGDGSTACAVILHDDGSMHGMADLAAAKRYMQAIY